MNADLSKRIDQYLPATVINFFHDAGRLIASKNQRLYLVGGVVRDILLGEKSLDIDLVVEGDAIALAKEIVQINPGKLTTHPQFETAKITWPKWSADITTARSETYAKPGALPTVKPGNIIDDLSRRDFTINAMAVQLNPDKYGELFDPLHGEIDLANRLIRILHENSFSDDATRIWRAIRYEQRLNFRIEEQTLRLLQKNIGMLDTISADRIWYEVECILREKYPEKVLQRAAQLGILKTISPVLEANRWMVEKFDRARQQTAPELPSLSIYLALMTYCMEVKEIQRLILRLHLPRTIARTLQDTADIKQKLATIARPVLSPKDIYILLHGFSDTALIAASIASDSKIAEERIHLFLDHLRYVKPLLTGDDIKRMRITSGPEIGLILERLRDSRLNGEAKTREDEEKLVYKWSAK